MALSAICSSHAMEEKNNQGPIIETERLEIRHITTDDAASLVPILGDPEVMHYFITGPLNPEKIEQYLHNKLLASYRENGWGRYALYKKDDGTFIGYCGLGMQSIGDGKQYIDLGYRSKKILGPRICHRGRKSRMHYAHNTLHISELIAITAAQHTASINVIEKIGFKFWKIGLFHSYPANIYRINVESKITFK